MQLNHQINGSGEPLIILHGLFGSLENWGAQVKTLSQTFSVITVDLRNHGRSPQSSEISYPLMAEDLRNLITDLDLTTPHILGHSMGGKVAMQLANELDPPIGRLIVADIAPVSYPRQHNAVFDGLFSIPLEQLKSRQEADKYLSEHVPEPAVRAFLLKNLYRNSEKQFQWRMNLQALYEQYDEIGSAPKITAPFTGKTLFIKGGQSDYLLAEHQSEILKRFPQASYKIIEGTGHWPHAEKPELFSRLVENFLTSA